MYKWENDKHSRKATLPAKGSTMMVNRPESLKNEQWLQSETYENYYKGNMK